MNSGSSLRSGGELASAGLVRPEQAAEVDAVAARYAIAIPPALAGLIDRNDPDDPIARQFVPDSAELETTPDEFDDPIGDEARSPVKGLVHRYPDRVLLMPTMSCQVYCRYCFRRDRVGRAAEAPGGEDLKAAFAYIEERPRIAEAILTGGDPLSLSDARLARIVRRLDEIPHLLNIRIHTRAPVAAPGRVTEALLDALRASKPVWMVLHCNHARELSADVAAACGRLTEAGIPLLSQSVLLRGINDDVDVLSELMRRFVALKIKPYYLHHPDRARGTARFRLPLADGRRLVDALRGRLSGLCQPTYVVDIPGGHGKAPVAEERASASADGWVLTDFKGNRHRYDGI